MYSGVRAKYLLDFLINSPRGWITRVKIIKTIHKTPQNANQLAIQLKVNYKTVKHHLEVLEKKRIVFSTGEKYGKTYFLTQSMENNYSALNEILGGNLETKNRPTKLKVIDLKEVPRKGFAGYVNGDHVQ